MKKPIFILIVIVLINLLDCHLVNAQKDTINTADFFNMSLEELLQVKVITAGKKEQEISEIPASVVLITRADIEKYGYQSLQEILESAPGIYTIDEWLPTGPGFGMRGFWNDIPNRNIVVLVNGVKQVYDLYSSNSLYMINTPVESIDRVEVIRGPMSVMYGTGAFYGAINIITNDAKNTKPSNLVATSGGTYSSYRLAARASGKKENFKFTINTSLYGTDGLDVPYNKVGHTIDGSTSEILNLQRRYFSFAGSFDDFYADFSYAETENHRPFLIHNDFDNNYTGKTVQNSQKSRIGYKKALSGKLTIDTRLDYNFSQTKIENDFGNIPNEIGEQLVVSRAIEAEIDVFYKPNDQFDFTVGINHRNVIEAYNMYDLISLGLTNYAEGLKDDNIATNAFFAQGNYKLANRFSIVAGFRLEQQSKYLMYEVLNGGIRNIDPDTLLPQFQYSYDEREFGSDDIAFIPNVALITKLNERNIIKLLYGEAINRPSFWQNKDFLGNTFPTLEPERIRTYELNYLGVYSSIVSVGLNLFRNELSNLIARDTYTDSNGTGHFIATNRSKIITNGVEMQLQINPLAKLNIDMSGTYQYTINEKDKDIEVSFSPSFLFYLKMHYHIASNISIALTGNYVDEMYNYYNWRILDPDAPSSEPIGYISNEEKVDGHFSLSANLRWENIIKGLYLSVRGANLLDSDIIYPVNRINAFAKDGTLGNGRFFMATLGYKF